MRQPKSKRAIARDQYDAVLLDLDGVITDTANLHAACWKQMFDEYLQKRATQRGEAFRPFDLAWLKQWVGSGTARTTWSTRSLSA
ncbi:MAG: beta-phosphoglucomutase family hydrolase [Thermomicrobiales bacterium]|nr:beta-phosphoglucomutase family hydrolase [Thermomicrobiales bacterium]